MSEPSARQRLDTPLTSRFRLTPRVDVEAVGQFSESIARYLGTGRYLMWQTIFVVVWIFLNLVAVFGRWDPYPFILLNLVAAMRNIDGAMEESAQATTQVSAAAEELTASIAEISFQAQRTRDISREVATQAGHAKDSIENLSAQSTKVGEIVGVITEISEQINLLALNAAIEAARAGEAGRAGGQAHQLQHPVGQLAGQGRGQLGLDLVAQGLGKENGSQSEVAHQGQLIKGEHNKAGDDGRRYDYTLIAADRAGYPAQSSQDDAKPEIVVMGENLIRSQSSECTDQGGAQGGEQDESAAGGGLHDLAFQSRVRGGGGLLPPWKQVWVFP
mgnify:CR=1 FL=1